MSIATASGLDMIIRSTERTACFSPLGRVAVTRDNARFPFGVLAFKRETVEQVNTDSSGTVNPRMWLQMFVTSVLQSARHLISHWQRISAQQYFIITVRASSIPNATSHASCGQTRCPRPCTAGHRLPFRATFLRDAGHDRK